MSRFKRTTMFSHKRLCFLSKPLVINCSTFGAIHSSGVSCRPRLSTATLHYRQLNKKVRESTYNIEFGALLNHVRPFERSYWCKTYVYSVSLEIDGYILM